MSDQVIQHLTRNGYAFLAAADMRRLLTEPSHANWPSFAASWNELSVDTYMADGGRYRRRRFAAFAVASNEISRKPHQPHYQSRDYNALNGGIERWFDPCTNEVAASRNASVLAAVLFTFWLSDKRPAQQMAC